MKSLPFTLTLAALAAAEPAPVAATPSAPPTATPPPAKAPEKSQWVFELLPKAFQKNPRLDLTVITEMTELGKKQPPASPEHPVYYLTFSNGFQQRGHAPANEHTLKQAEVERLLTRALAVSGFLPAQPPAHPPTLVIFYTWGSHNLLVEGDEENPSLSGDLVARNILDRAALVGGEKFAERMLKLFEEEDMLRASTTSSTAVPPGAMGPVVGPDQLAFMSPMHTFRMDAKNDFLVDQTANDVYYVVASAYDYTSIPTKTKRLFWRTRMSVAAQGVSQEQTLPTLITTAGPYFGKDMTEVEILTRRTVPEGKVEIGEPRVVGTEDSAAKKTAPSAKP